MFSTQSSTSKPMLWFEPIKSQEDCGICLESMKDTDTIGHDTHVFHRDCISGHEQNITKQQIEKKRQVQERQNEINDLVADVSRESPGLVPFIENFGNEVIVAARAQKIQELVCPLCREPINPNSILRRRDRVFNELKLIKSDMIEGSKIGAVVGVVSAALFGVTLFQTMNMGPIRSEINRIAGTKAGFLLKTLTGVVLGMKETMPYSFIGASFSFIYSLHKGKKNLDHIAMISVFFAAMFSGAISMKSGSQGFYLGAKTLIPKSFTYIVSGNLQSIAACIGTVFTGTLCGAASGAVYGTAIRFVGRRLGY